MPVRPGSSGLLLWTSGALLLLMSSGVDEAVRVGDVADGGWTWDAVQRAGAFADVGLGPSQVS